MSRHPVEQQLQAIERLADEIDQMASISVANPWYYAYRIRAYANAVRATARAARSALADHLTA